MTVTQKNNKGPFHGVQLPQLKPNVDISGKSGRVLSTEEIIDLLKVYQPLFQRCITRKPKTLWIHQFTLTKII